MNIPDDLDMGEMGMDGAGKKKGGKCKETDSGCPQECVGDCDKVGRIYGSKECPNVETHKGMYDAVIFGERREVAGG